jgi:hypothetical protein
VIEGDLEDGDPFAPGLTDYQRAARLQGRKIITKAYQGEEEFESMYLVLRFHQFFEGRGSAGKGIVQFFGPRARRRYRTGERKPKWDVGPEDLKHTVELGGAIHDFTLKPREK